MATAECHFGGDLNSSSGGELKLYLKWKRKTGRLIYSLQLGRCIVIQVANDFPIYTEPKYIRYIFEISCVVNLYQELIPETNRLIQYEILGFVQLLKSIASESQQHPLKFNYSYVSEDIQTSFKNWSDVSRFGIKCKGHFQQVKIFSSTIKTFTPHVSQVYLHFNLWKSSVYNIDIKISHSEVPDYQLDIHFEEWKYPESFLQVQSKFNSHIFVVQIQNITKCFGESKNNSALTFQLLISASTDISHYVNIYYMGDSGQQHLSLSMTVHLSCLEPVYYLSLPGHVGISDYKSVGPYMDITVQSFWINGILKKHKDFICYSKRCENRIENFINLNIFNISYQALEVQFQNHLIYVIFKSNIIINNNDMFDVESLHHSWKTASNLCKALGGHLPVFYDRADIEEFASFFKVAKLPLIDAIFIGLFFDRKEKVSDQKYLNNEFIADIK